MVTLDDRVVDAAEGFLDDPRSYLGAQRVLQVAVESPSSTQAESLLPWARESLVRISKKALGNATLQPLLDAALLTTEALFHRVMQARVTLAEGVVYDATRHILREYAPRLFLILHRSRNSCTPNSYCFDLESLLALSVIKPPEVGTTEFSYIPFWNMLIHESIKGYLQTSVSLTFDRNTNCETRTLSQLPDYVGYVGALYSLFRGEEKAVRGPGNPKQELMDKLVWVYKDVPYLLGYHARGPNVTFGALYHGGGKVQCQDLVTVDLSSMTDRVQSQLILFNLGRVLVGLCDLCSRRNEISDTFTVQEVDLEKGGKSVVLSGQGIYEPGEGKEAPCAAATLSGACHAPEIPLGPHDTAVDVWGVGWLIHTSKVTLTQELEELRDDCLEEQPKARPTMTSCTDRLQKMFANLDEIELLSICIILWKVCWMAQA
ncbi:hypothetical protein SELMODRAFT_424394 [Selaginella moellendorffii]|uniref:Protein kinase domain-containing protein n=1 Tax=Selaginella moellendorffii TaxID=88036 RepID=D8SPR2_SELML|nr:hypothetical protein SELMODRAFT_424394 [Selaginella moellendorffii]